MTTQSTLRFEREQYQKKPVRVSTGGQFHFLFSTFLIVLFYQDFFAVHDVNALLSLVEALTCDIVD